MIPYFVIVLAAILIGLLVHWELIVCEGVHLGPRVVVWLYDRFAPRYDGVKRFDEVDESHAIIQYRAVTHNLDAIAGVLTALARGEQVPSISIEGRKSAVWGQPRFTAYLHWKSEARRKRHANRIPALS